MAEHPTNEEAIRKIFEAKILNNFRRSKSAAEVEKIEDEGLLNRRVKFRKLIEQDVDFYIVYHSAHIAAAWLSMLSVSIFHEMSDEGAEDPLDEQVAALVFFSRLASDLWAIIELIELGFDLQARALTRAYLEHVDVLICCIQDRELTREFVNAKEPEAANAFWHRHASKNRAKAKVTRFIAGVLGLDTVTVVDVLREDADFAGSALLHPTMVAGLATAFGAPDVDYEESFPVFPNPVSASAGILRTILVHLFWLSFATGGQPSASSGSWQPIFRVQGLRDDLEVQRLSLLHTRMFQFLIHNEILMKPTSDDADNEA